MRKKVNTQNHNRVSQFTNSQRCLMEVKPWRSYTSIALIWSYFCIGIAFVSLEQIGIFSTLLLQIFFGIIAYHLNIIGHDGIHWNLSKSKTTNDFLCRFLLHGPHFAPLSAFRRSHLNHHRFLGKAIDQDRQYYDLSEKTRFSFLAWLASSWAGGTLFPIISKLLFPPDQSTGTRRPLKIKTSLMLDIFSIIFSQSLLIMVFYFFTDGFGNYFVFWVFPIFTVMIGINTIRSCLEHANLNATNSNNLLFSVNTNPIEKMILAPYNMNYHAEHHIQPRIPFYNLKKFRLLCQNSGYSYTISKNYTERLLDVCKQLYERNNGKELGFDYFGRGHVLSNIQEVFSIKARMKMLKFFNSNFSPKEGDSVCDLGSTPDISRRDSNCMIPELLKNGLIVDAYSIENIDHLKSLIPSINKTFSNIKFSDQGYDGINEKYDWVIASAVIEHVGNDSMQKKFIQESLRIAKKGVMITTPNRWHWLEFHTKIPLLHWLPKKIHRKFLRVLRISPWHREDILNLLDKENLENMVDKDGGITLKTKYIWSLGGKSNIVLLLSKSTE